MMGQRSENRKEYIYLYQKDKKTLGKGLLFLNGSDIRKEEIYEFCPE